MAALHFRKVRSDTYAVTRDDGTPLGDVQVLYGRLWQATRHHDLAQAGFRTRSAAAQWLDEAVS